jgi:hypothetical protein
MSVLVINDVPIECINHAAVKYHVPATVIISVLKTENGHVGDANVNTNGTVDYGPMQINTIWLKQLRPYGYTAQSIQYDPCVNVEVGAWILGRNIADGKSLWEGIGDYHSHQARLNHHYRNKVNDLYSVLTQYLNSGVRPPPRQPSIGQFNDYASNADD